MWHWCHHDATSPSPHTRFCQNGNHTTWNERTASRFRQVSEVFCWFLYLFVATISQKIHCISPDKGASLNLCIHCTLEDPMTTGTFIGFFWPMYLPVSKVPKRENCETNCKKRDFHWTLCYIHYPLSNFHSVRPEGWWKATQTFKVLKLMESVVFRDRAFTTFDHKKKNTN